MNMSGYTKLFSSILASTIWQESKETKIIWITMLAASNQYGVVEASIPGLAHMAMLTIGEAEAALGVLMAPDPYSRTPAFEGRRIKPTAGGWQILNHDKYREQMSAAERKEYNRIKQKESRDRRKARGDEDVKTEPETSMTVNDSSASQRHTEAKEDSKAEADVLLVKEPKGARVAEFAELVYAAYPVRVGKPYALKKIKTALTHPPKGIPPEEWPTELLAITRRYAAIRAGQEYTPNPATWFNQRRFEDDPATWAAKNGNGNGTHHTVESLF